MLGRPAPGPACREPAELHVQQSLGDQPVEVEAGPVQGQVHGRGGLLAADRFGLRHDVLVERPAGGVGEDADAGRLTAQIHGGSF